jgi:hypothetical protein
LVDIEDGNTFQKDMKTFIIISQQMQMQMVGGAMVQTKVWMEAFL